MAFSVGGWPERVRGWPEVTQQWDKWALHDVWAEDEVAAGPEQRTSQLFFFFDEPALDPRQAGTVSPALPVHPCPTLTAQSHLLPFLSVLSTESPHLSLPVGLAQPGYVWGEPCLARHSPPFLLHFGVTRPRWRLQSQRIWVQVQTLLWNLRTSPPCTEPQFSFLKDGNSERPALRILNVDL